MSSELIFSINSRSDIKKTASSVIVVLNENKTYGHRRIANVIGRGKNSTLRIMKKFGLEPIRRKPKRFRKKADLGTPNSNIPNLIETTEISRPDEAWVEDFTYIRFHGSFVYLATVLDVFTREVLW